MASIRPPHAPETWPRAEQLARRLFGSLERFLQVEAASGIILLVAAVAALLWANSALAASYTDVWHTPITLGIGGAVFERSLHFWINEGLMTVFFFVVGLEIRREMHEGELSDLKKAALPVIAAIGGMLVPALIYYSFNRGTAASHGWGVPTATDIAFAVGVLALLGKRVPPALRVLLLALAIIDDIGAIIVIALFYSSGVVVDGILIAVLGVTLVVVFQRFGVRKPIWYVAPGFVVWIGMLKSGIHPTIAGVALGLLTPAKSWFGGEGFVAEANDALHIFQKRTKAHDGTHSLLDPLRRIRDANREALPPVVSIQAALHPWVAYGIMPLFALANAGVGLQGVSLDKEGLFSISAGVIFGLVLGKPIGILLASFLSVRLGISALPKGVNWRGILLVGSVAGIGFTMAIFIAGLAFAAPEQLSSAKLAVLIASTTAACAGLVVGKFVLPSAPEPGAALTLQEAEMSTER